MNVYVASSWRNVWQPGVVRILRSKGHDVYDFRNPKPGHGGFHWSEIDPSWKDWTPAGYRIGLEHPLAREGFAHDMGALRRCDACVLVQPCGRSAHLELGWACGAGKRTAILFPLDMRVPDADHRAALLALLKVEPELMTKMVGCVLLSESELLGWASAGAEYHPPQKTTPEP